jgi:hypothetical protein
MAGMCIAIIDVISALFGCCRSAGCDWTTRCGVRRCNNAWLDVNGFVCLCNLRVSCCLQSARRWNTFFLFAAVRRSPMIDLLRIVACQLLPWFCAEGVQCMTDCGSNFIRWRTQHRPWNLPILCYNPVLLAQLAVGSSYLRLMHVPPLAWTPYNVRRYPNLTAKLVALPPLIRILRGMSFQAGHVDN